jgi:hypothetical protein
MFSHLLTDFILFYYTKLHARSYAHTEEVTFTVTIVVLEAFPFMPAVWPMLTSPRHLLLADAVM